MQQISYFILEAKIENFIMYIVAVKLAVGNTILNEFFQGK
jgi:hypothetical protein